MIVISVTVYFIASRTLRYIQSRHFLPGEMIFSGDAIYSCSLFYALATMIGLFALFPILWPEVWHGAKKIKHRGRSFSLDKLPLVFVIMFSLMLSVSIWFTRYTNQYVKTTTDYIVASKASLFNNEDIYDYNQIDIYRRDDKKCYKFVFNKTKEIECVSALAGEEADLVNTIQLAQIKKKYKISEIQSYHYEPKGFGKYVKLTSSTGLILMFLIFSYLSNNKKNKQNIKDVYIAK